MREPQSILIEEGSTNVYANLGYADAAEMQRNSQLAGEIARAIKARHLTQEAAAALSGVDPSKVSRITRGQFRGVSVAMPQRLMLAPAVRALAPWTGAIPYPRRDQFAGVGHWPSSHSRNTP